MRLHFTTSILLPNIWPFLKGFNFLSECIRVIVCVCGGGGYLFLFLRMGGCYFPYFQGDVSCYLEVKDFLGVHFVHILYFYYFCSVSYFVYWLCFQLFDFLSGEGLKIVHILFLVYLTIFRSSCRLKLGYKYNSN